MRDPTERFSSRVENYVRYRPGYPPALVDLLAAHCQLTPQTRVADVGSGTGKLTALFVQHGNPVWAVEPNAEMRHAAERLLAGRPGFVSVAGRAEATTLPDASVDLVAAGQAFHWFQREPARLEFARILRPGGWVALVWNERRRESSPFQVAYEHLLHAYAIDYAQVDHRRVTPQDLAAFFAPAPYRRHVLSNEQQLDRAGVQGRLLSSSYSPEEGHPNHAPMLAALDAVFDAHQVDGLVTVEYDTTVYLGHLEARP
ncbi:MAG: class I SAM-dependent methyltransferase [Chloroflexi bacterium]|nr:class I SAM-dependent methyltransferase [Chloroflexota bacterium]MBU1747334.1 class I SAM-dependent methyltransferase [Chloroflexota bacterium]MBU1878691.1 class I SAM-dependent methyltransferase [Chloroflexota bacterium]